jgi:hypothetical protein
MFFVPSAKCDPRKMVLVDFRSDSVRRELSVAFLLHDGLNGNAVSQRSRAAEVAEINQPSSFISRSDKI